MLSSLPLLLPARKVAVENSNSKWSSLQGAEHFPVPEMRIVRFGNCRFEFLNRIEDVDIEPLDALGESCIKRCDFETIRRGFNAAANFQTLGADFVPKTWEPLVVESAEYFANVSFAVFAKGLVDSFIVVWIVIAHLSNASRFSFK